MLEKYQKLLINLPNDFLIIADSGDNPTAGGVG